jgi:restriction system protein
MNWKLNDDSLFAILLRSSWWISFLIAGAVTAAAVALLPEPYKLYGIPSGLPFWVIGCMAAWKQLQAPSATRIDNTLAAVRAMSWAEFSRAIEAAYQRQGYGVTAVSGSAANFEITKEGRTALVSCKRWKVARTGVEPLHDLHAMREARNAHECIYVAAGDFSDNARSFAVKHRIRLVGGPELARLMPGEGKARKAS